MARQGQRVQAQAGEAHAQAVILLLLLRAMKPMSCHLHDRNQRSRHAVSKQHGGCASELVATVSHYTLHMMPLTRAPIAPQAGPWQATCAACTHTTGAVGVVDAAAAAVLAGAAASGAGEAAIVACRQAHRRRHRHQWSSHQAWARHGQCRNHLVPTAPAGTTAGRGIG